MLQQQSSSSLQTPKTGRSRFSKALPALPPIEPIDLFGNTMPSSSSSAPFSPIPKSTNTPATTAAPATTTLRSPYSPFPHTPSSTSARRKATTETKSSAPDTTKLYSPLPPIPQSTSPLVASFQQSQPTRPPAMSIPRRPVAKVEAPPLPAEPPSPSRSVLSLLSAYSRSSGESLMRTSDNDVDLSTNSSSEPTLSPTHEKLPEPTTDYSLPPRSTSLAPKSPGGLGNMTMSSRLPSNSNNDPTPSPLHLGPLPPIPVRNGRRLPASPRDGLVGGPAPLVGSTPATPATATIPPTTIIAPTTTTTTTTKPKPIRNPASPQSTTTSELLTRRSLKSNQSLEVPELKLTSNSNNNNNNNNQDNNTSDPDLLITPSFSSNPPLSSSHQNSPARPIQAPFYSPRSQSRNALESLKVLPLQPGVEARQENKEKGEEKEKERAMGKAASRIKDKLQGLRTDNETLLGVGRKDKGLPSPPSQLQSPISPLNIANTNNVVSPLTPEMPKEAPKEQPQPRPETNVTQTQPQQQQQQQNLGQEKQYQPLPPPVSAWAPAAANRLHTVRSLPDLKPAAGPQTSSERPPAISPEYVNNEAGSFSQDQSQPEPQPQQKFPPRTTSTRNHGLAGQKQPQPQQTQQRSRAGTESGNLNDIRPPSLDRRLERVASHPNFATEYGTANVPTPPASQGRQSDGTVYRELIQEDLPEPDPRAMYFPTTQTTRPQPTGPNAVFKPPQLTKAHHGCFQKHTKMIMARNKHYSLACQTCEVEDNELRWQCAWCRLRVCGTCMRLLQTYQRDLGRVLEHIKNPPPTPPASHQQAEGAQRVSGSQGGSRPGSAEALAAVVEEASEGAGQGQVQGQARGQTQGTRQSQGQDQQQQQQEPQPQSQQQQQFYAYDGRGYGQPQGYGQDMYYGQQPRGPMLRQQQSIQDMRQ